MTLCVRLHVASRKPCRRSTPPLVDFRSAAFAHEASTMTSTWSLFTLGRLRCARTCRSSR
eukprot:15149132-Heterocapsa_arctica.AAC.1